MAVVKSKKARKYSIKTFIFLFLIKFFIADPNAAHGDIDIGQIINATNPIKIVEINKFSSFGKNPDAAIEDIVHAFGLTI